MNPPFAGPRTANRACVTLRNRVEQQGTSHIEARNSHRARARMDAARTLLRRVAKDHEDQHGEHPSGDQSDHRLAVIHEYDHYTICAQFTMTTTLCDLRMRQQSCKVVEGHLALSSGPNTLLG